jgi:hypothetical protein
MNYQLFVTQFGDHFMTSNVISNIDDAMKLYKDLNEKYNESDGYAITLVGTNTRMKYVIASQIAYKHLEMDYDFNVETDSPELLISFNNKEDEEDAVRNGLVKLAL